MGLTRLAAAAIAFAGIAGFAAVGLGAWAAHGLAPQPASWVETASRYAMWHSLAIVGAALLAERLAGGARRLAVIAVVLFAVGIVAFSGSLVALAFGGPGAAAPFGGIAFMVGWVLFASAGVAALRGRTT